MTYISAQQAASQWGISKRRVQTLCSGQRIPGSVRIGNMWVLPEDARKPNDARKRTGTYNSNLYTNPIRAARRSIKAFSTMAYKMVQEEVSSASEAKRTVMAQLARELILSVLASTSYDHDERASSISSCLKDLFGVNIQLSTHTSECISKEFKRFLIENPYCSDDALSWSYQYINKLSLDTGLESTQFFTEKYMITALTDRCGIKNGTGKILDPSCGGGNFLLYSLDYLCDRDRIKPIVISPDYVRRQLMRLYGYELDSTLAVVSSVNLRIKALSILKENGYDITLGDFLSYTPNIYSSVKDNIKGALDTNASTHYVVRVGDDQVESLESVLGSPEYILTNPPFRTVKGMAANLKSFLNMDYPNAKCDMCNAFIEFALRSLNENGVCGLVVQSSWMYLDSFEEFRRALMARYTISLIIELGSNAFYDINGEKANVSLLMVRKTHPDNNTAISLYSLRNLAQSEKEQVLSSWDTMNDRLLLLNQLEVTNTPGLRLGVASTVWISSLYTKHPQYNQYAVPMQGTSTGDSKSLVCYFWEHIGDSDWCPVSKGGGYSRWLGLNSFSVKWGRDGEYIKKTPGSAIRNANYFKETQLVFSDTGTAGLNVRLLHDSQIFIASGPGIRITKGNPLSHMAFLNSRFSSFFLQLLSPKLTIAAGYIGKIPTVEELLFSEELGQYARNCVSLKRTRLKKRPIYLEFEALVDINQPTTLDEQVKLWLLSDIECEWLQLCEEMKIDKLVLDAYSLSNIEKDSIDAQVSCHALAINKNGPLPLSQLDDQINESLSMNCMLKKSRKDKNHLGCDGIIEYTAHENVIPPRQIYLAVMQDVNKLEKTLAKYRDAYIHYMVISALGYTVHSQMVGFQMKMSAVADKVAEVFPSLHSDYYEIRKWIDTKFADFHKAAFLNVPILQLSADYCTIKPARR